MKIWIVLVLPLLVFLTCNSADAEKRMDDVAYHPDEAFNAYWYNGEAELTKYRLEQARYGHIHHGEAVYIFVTEPVDPLRHVKTSNQETGIPVLKLNATRKFETGIYPYSLMTTTMTPVNVGANPHSLRVTFTGQEWCGHVFASLDRQRKHFAYESFSYFEQEGHQTAELALTFLEDEVPNRIRIKPFALPRGQVKIIPPLLHSRLLHQEHKPYTAMAKMEPAVRTDSAYGRVDAYRIRYEDLDREVVYEFQHDFPHRLLAWEESYNSFGHPLVTRATAVETMTNDYWNLHNPQDSVHRFK